MPHRYKAPNLIDVSANKSNQIQSVLKNKSPLFTINETLFHFTGIFSLVFTGSSCSKTNAKGTEQQAEDSDSIYHWEIKIINNYVFILLLCRINFAF